MVHTRSGAGSEPLTLPAGLEATAELGVRCPVCYETRSMQCMALASCGHGICLACAPRMFMRDFEAGVKPSCPECRAEAVEGQPLYKYMYEPGFRPAALKMLRRLSLQ